LNAMKDTRRRSWVVSQPYQEQMVRGFSPPNFSALLVPLPRFAYVASWSTPFPDDIIILFVPTECLDRRPCMSYGSIQGHHITHTARHSTPYYDVISRWKHYLTARQDWQPFWSWHDLRTKNRPPRLVNLCVKIIL
jgi:hypothetical protein